MQGANLKINLYAIAFLFPLAGVGAVVPFGETAWFITCVALAVFSIAIHKWFIAKIAAIFEKNKYKRMEKFMEKLSKHYTLNIRTMDIKIQILKKIYNGNTVLDIDNQGVANGELIGLVGNNGAGKTAVLSDSRPDSGR